GIGENKPNVQKQYFKIEQGLLVLVGIGPSDTENLLKTAAQKLVKLRIFEDESGKMKRDVAEINGKIALVSQFTLFASLKKGNRPDFLQAAAPDLAKMLYERFIQEVTALHAATFCSPFGLDLDVDIHNSGPVTIPIDFV